VASVASIRNPQRLCTYDPKDYKLIIIDETHHAAASSYLSIQKHFGADSPNTPVAVAGFSATMSRHDGLSLGSVLDHIVYHKELIEMIREGNLCDMKITVVNTDANLSDVPTLSGSGDFNTRMLSAAVNTDSLNRLVVNSWKYHSEGGRKYTRTLVFGVDIAHVRDMANCFSSNGVVAEYVTSDTDLKHRTELIQRFTDGHFPVLINCGIFTEGTDIPAIDQVIINRPTKSRNLLTQMVGRGLRNHDGKVHCHVIDMVGSLETGTLATVPTLAGLDPMEVVSTTVNVGKEVGRREPKPRPEITVNKVEITSYSNILQFTTRGKLSTNHQNLDSTIRLRLYNWLRVNKSSYILASMSGYLRLEINSSKDDSSTTFTIRRLLRSPFRKSGYTKFTMLENEVDIYRALNLAEKYAVAKFGFINVTRKAPWRRQPMSENQLKALFLSAQKSLNLRESQLPDWIKLANKGQAADLLSLSSVTQGAIFRRLVENKEKSLKAQYFRSQRERMESPDIKVGPIKEDLIDQSFTFDEDRDYSDLI
jgi:ATP-dependent helicase IRC3